MKDDAIADRVRGLDREVRSVTVMLSMMLTTSIDIWVIVFP